MENHRREQGLVNGERIDVENLTENVEKQEENEGQIAPRSELLPQNLHSQQPTHEVFQSFIRNIEDTIEAIRSLKQDRYKDLEEAKKWLPILEKEMKEGEIRLSKVITRSHPSRPLFTVINSEFGLGAKSLENEKELDEESKEYLRAEYIRYSLHHLEKICSEYLSFNLEDLKKRAQEVSKNENDEVAPLPQETVKEVGEAEEKVRIEETQYTEPNRITKWLSKGARALLSGAALPGLIIAEASPAVSILLAKLMPEKFSRLLWKRMQDVSSMQQAPGVAPGFLDKFAPVVLEHEVEEHRSGRADDFMVSVKNFSAYNAKTDSFEEKEIEQKQVHEFVPAFSERYMRTETRVNLHTLTLFHFGKGIEREKKTGLVKIPLPVEGANQLAAVPIELKITAGAGGEKISVKLYYDEDKNLYFNPDELPAHFTDASLELTHFLWSPQNRENLFRTSQIISEFEVQNRAFFQQKEMSLDDTAANVKVDFPVDIQTQMLLWQDLETSEQKAEAVREYFCAHFGYPTRFMSSLRIKAARGSNDLEKIMNAKESNCYDANRVAYIILQKLGVPCELQTGFASTPETGKKPYWPRDFIGIENMKKEKTGTTIGTRSDLLPWRNRGKSSMKVSTTAAHAFLKYWDSEAGIRKTIDATPFKKKHEIKRDLAWEQKRQWRENTIADINKRYNLESLPTEFRESKYVAWRIPKNHQYVRPYTILIPDGKKTKMQAQARLNIFNWPYLNYDRLDPGPNSVKDVKAFEAEYLKEYQSYLSLSSLHEDIQKILDQSYEKTQGIIKSAATVWLKEAQFRNRELKETSVEDVVTLLLADIIPVPETEGTIYDAGSDRYMFGAHYSNDNDGVVRGKILSREELLQFVQKSMGEWSNHVKDRLVIIKEVLEKSHKTYSLTDIENQIIEKITGEKIELTEPEKLVFDWVYTGGAEAEVTEDKGKKKIKLKDPITGKEYFVENVKD